MKPSMKFIDTHCHLYDEAFAEDLDEVVNRLQDSGVCACILPGIDNSSYDSMLSVADKLPELTYPCIGLHPTSVAENWQEELSFVKNHLDDRKFYAIGEIGMDEYWSKDFVKQQKTVFAEQIELAVKKHLPIIIHNRDAMADTMDVLSDFKNSDISGVFHAYSGSYETYCELLKLGDFKIGIGGVLTYKNAGIASILPKISLHDIILETDCPYLTPVPFRGKRNESSYIPFIAKKIEELTSVPLETIADTTTSNAKKLFKI